MHIDAYSFGSITVDGGTYSRDLIIFSDRINSAWWRGEAHRLQKKDLEEVFRYKPELLIVGTGASGMMKVPDDLRHELQQEHIDCEVHPTGEAVKRFNQECAAGKRVAGAFHLTC